MKTSETLKSVGFVILSCNGQYIGIDLNSGGYPFPTSSLRSAEIYDNKEAALKEANSPCTHGTFGPCTVKEFFLRVSE